VAIVQVECPTCGVLKVVPRLISVDVAELEIRFECPQCGTSIRQKVDNETVDLLERAGAVMIRPPIVRRPITTDDLIEFHEHIEDEIRELLR
jgi:predicted RNA-binding Zn-ribbon protein involved in translation (DUF1610 family)